MSETHAAPSAATTSLDVRQDLVDALKVDLVGPGTGHELAGERLPANEAPSKSYLTGLLIPPGTPPELSASRADEDDDLDEIPGRAGLAPRNPPRTVRRRRRPVDGDHRPCRDTKRK